MLSANFQTARQNYAYVPACLVKTSIENDVGLTWSGAHFVPDIPADWARSRRHHPSKKLDDFHSGLLNSSHDIDIMHGLLSTVFWGYVSGTNGRITVNRALSKSRMLLDGRGSIVAQDPDEVISHLRSARELVLKRRLARALNEVRRIRFLGMSFASKVLMFMAPDIASVYDDVISQRLKVQEDHDLRRLHVSTAHTASQSIADEQASAYEGWCNWCSERSSVLNTSNITWCDWDGAIHRWRAVDVERAFFALGRPE